MPTSDEVLERLISRYGMQCWGNGERYREGLGVNETRCACRTEDIHAHVEARVAEAYQQGVASKNAESVALQTRAEKAEADLAREQRLHNESRRLHADTIQKAQLLGHAHAKTAERLHRLRTRYRENLELATKRWRERAEKAGALLAQLDKDAANV